jgi:hypothetical protein
MNQEMYEALLAEIAALNVALIKTMGAVSRMSGDQKAFLRDVLEFGLHDLPLTMYQGVPQNRYPAFLEKAKEKYRSIVSAIRVP